MVAFDLDMCRAVIKSGLADLWERKRSYSSVHFFFHFHAVSGKIGQTKCWRPLSNPGFAAEMVLYCLFKNGQTCLINFLLILVVGKKIAWQFKFQIQVISPSINLRNQPVTLQKSCTFQSKKFPLIDFVQLT